MKKNRFAALSCTRGDISLKIAIAENVHRFTNEYFLSLLAAKEIFTTRWCG